MADGIATNAKRLAMAAGLVMNLCGTAQSVPVQWTVASGGNGHYYETRSEKAIAWSPAKSLAETLNHDGLQGYLATITSAEEQDFVVNNLSPFSGWIGASNEGVAGTWKWVTGPEAGQTFYVRGAAVQPGYSNWSGPSTSGSPDQPLEYPAGLASHAIMWGPDGEWIVGGLDGEYFAIVEYGGIKAVPGPAALVLMGSALAALAVAFRKKAA